MLKIQKILKMKKVILIASFAIISILLSNQAFACEPGWFQRDIPLPNYPGCPSLVAHVCVKCSPLDNIMQVKYDNFTGACSGYNLQSYMDFTTAIINANATFYCLGAWIPCNEGGWIIEYKRPTCFYQNDEDLTQFIACDGSWCLSQFLQCLEDGVIRTIVFGWPTYPKLEGTPYLGCTEKNWPQPPGTCFHVPNPCMP